MSRRTLSAALRDLESETVTVRADAAIDLGLAAHESPEEATRALERALVDEAPEVRQAAALAIADASLDQAADALVAACDDAHRGVVANALTALGEIRASRALEAVSGKLDHPEPSIRFQAVIAFARVSLDERRTAQVLLDATRDRDPLVRHIALRMAEEVGSGDQRPVDPIFETRAEELLDDESATVRVAAAVVLGRCGRRDGAQILQAVAGGSLSTSEADDEAAAIELCGELRLAAAEPLLARRAFGRAGLLTRDPFAWQARVALAALGHPRATRWILSELTAWNRERRTLAVAAAGRARLAEARPLVDAMRGRPERADPHAVDEALQQLAVDERGMG